MRVWGAIYGAVTLVIWSLVFLRTLTMLRNGQIFESPCIEEIDMARGQAKAIQLQEVPAVTRPDGAHGTGSQTQWSGTTYEHLRPSQSL